MIAIIIFTGITLALGIWLVCNSQFRTSHINFSERIAPQLKSVQLRSTRTLVSAQNQAGFLNSLLILTRQMILKMPRWLASSALSQENLARRLIQEGKNRTPGDFRAEQLIWAATAFLASGILLALGFFQGKVHLLGSVLLTLACSYAGFMLRDWWLGESIKQREKSMLEEFPALAELMALSVTAGESAIGSLERVCRCSSGELASEFKIILAQTRAGDGLVSALQDFSLRTSIPELSRFVDGIVVAIERGTPLAEVLRAQAQDVRDSAKRQLLETAGKKEIAMMAPVIFFVLPLTVVFAVFPGIALLNINF